MFFRLKKFWSSIVIFFEGYSVDSLIEALRYLIKQIIENGINSGNILVRLISLPFLFILILILGIIIGVKKIFINFFKLIKKGARFVTKIITAIVREVGFYWEVANKKGKLLLKTEKYRTQKLVEYSKYQLYKIKDDGAKIPSENMEIGYIKLTSTFIAQLVGWLIFVLLACIMSALLVAIPILVPVSKYIREKNKSRGT